MDKAGKETTDMSIEDKEAEGLFCSPHISAHSHPFGAVPSFSSVILVLIRMKVHSEKRLELSQTLVLLSGSIRMEKGCRRCDFCQNVEKEDELCLLEEWDTEESFMSHLKSERFKVLRGAMNLLKEPYEMMFHTVSHPARLEKV